MALGALIDAGADFDSLKQELARLGIDEYEIRAEKTTKRGITATDVAVKLYHHHNHGRKFSEIKRVIEESGLSDGVKSRAVAMFRRLGEAEAKIHGKDIEDIHFHEVGAVDALVDIVGACICLDLLKIEKVYSSPMPTFHGRIEIAHGIFPLPAPATAEILKGVPWQTVGVEGELVTPTGAAIITEIATSYGPMPEMISTSIGYGAGKQDFGMPNVLRVIVGEVREGEAPAEPHNAPSANMDDEGCREVAVLETNIDDLSPQVYEVVMDRLFEAGALDVYLTPIQMKKNRPATLLSVMCDPADVDKMSNILFEETSTIGIRIDTRRRICLRREIAKVKTKYGQIRVKIARKAGLVINAHPEFDDCKAAALDHGVPVKLVIDATIAAFYSKGG